MPVAVGAFAEHCLVCFVAPGFYPQLVGCVESFSSCKVNHSMKFKLKYQIQTQIQQPAGERGKLVAGQSN
jgi:hypothetical protein